MKSGVDTIHQTKKMKNSKKIKIRSVTIVQLLRDYLNNKLYRSVIDES